MINRQLQKQIFGQATNYDQTSLSKQLSDNLLAHKIDISRANDVIKADELHLTLPNLIGRNIDEHFRAIALEQTEEYVSLGDRLLHWNAPKHPIRWCFQPGWTR